MGVTDWLLIAFCFCELISLISSAENNSTTNLLLETHIGSNYYNYYKIGTEFSNIQNVFMYRNDVNRFLNFFNQRWRSIDEFKYKELNGKTLQVQITKRVPYIFDSDEGLSGFLIEIWTIVEEAFNFTSNYSEFHTDFDVLLDCLVPVGVSERHHYSQGLNRDGYALYIRKPESSADGHSYVKVFSPGFWWMTFVCFCICILCLACVAFYVSDEVKDSSLGVCMLSAVAGFSNQGAELQFKSLSGRIATITLLLVGVMIYTAFSAVLMSIWAIEKKTLPIESLGDVKRSGSYALCMRTGNIIWNYMGIFTKPIEHDGLIAEILPEWQGIVNRPGSCINIHDSRRIRKIICKPNIVIFELVSVMVELDYFGHFPCKYVQASREYFKLNTQIGFTKYWPYRPYIDMILNKIRDSGLLARIVDQWLKSQNLETDTKSKVTYISFSHITVVYSLYIYLMIACLVILIIELCVANYN